MGNNTLEHRTISISGLHYNGEDAVYYRKDNANVTELDVHNINSFLEGIAT